jgi:hypothetical protein
MRPAGLQDLGELGPLFRECVGEAAHLRREGAADGHRRHVKRRRKGVVGGLTEIDVVVGIDRGTVAARLAEDFRRAPAEHLIDVHVEGGPGACLVYVDHELVSVLSGEDLVAGCDDRLKLLRRQPPEFRVGLRASLLDPDVGAHHLRMCAFAGNRIVLDGARCLRAPVGLVGDLPDPETVFLLPQSSSPPGQH